MLRFRVWKAAGSQKKILNTRVTGLELYFRKIILAKSMADSNGERGDTIEIATFIFILLIPQ